MLTTATGCICLQYQAHQSDWMEMGRKAFHLYQELPEMKAILILEFQSAWERHKVKQTNKQK